MAPVPIRNRGPHGSSRPVGTLPSRKTGSAGTVKIRTDWTLALTMGIPFSRWGATPFICSPVPFPTNTIAEMSQKGKGMTRRAAASVHPFELAVMWNRQIDVDPTLNKAKIAAREGLSRARVTQIMNPLQLPDSIQQQLMNPPPPLKIHVFHERRLRALLAQNDSVHQLQEWQQWLDELWRSGEN